MRACVLQAADGYVRGESCVTLLLATQPPPGLEASTLGTITGSAVNQDGRSSSLTAPNGPSQQAVITSAWQDARCALADMASLQVSQASCEIHCPLPPSDAVILCRGDLKCPYACLCFRCTGPGLLLEIPLR